jgi:hypothetical protein
MRLRRAWRKLRPKGPDGATCTASVSGASCAERPMMREHRAYRHLPSLPTRARERDGLVLAAAASPRSFPDHDA